MGEMAALHGSVFWLVISSLLPYQFNKISKETCADLYYRVAWGRALTRKGTRRGVASKSLTGLLLRQWGAQGEMGTGLSELFSCQRRQSNLLSVWACTGYLAPCNRTFCLNTRLALSDVLNFHINSRTAAKGKNPKSPEKGKKCFDFWKKSILDSTLIKVWKPMDWFQILWRNPLGILE